MVTGQFSLRLCTWWWVGDIYYETNSVLDIEGLRMRVSKDTSVLQFLLFVFALF